MQSISYEVIGQVRIKQIGIKQMLPVFAVAFGKKSSKGAKSDGARPAFLFGSLKKVNRGQKQNGKT